MSTYLDFLDGEVTLRIAGNAQKFVDKLERDAGVTWESRRIGVVYFKYWGEASSDWEQVLSNALNEYADAWDIEAKEKWFNPVRFWKNKSGEGKVYGKQIFYYPGFEDDFIRHLPQEVIDRIKGTGQDNMPHVL
jgi:hypothetical protein